MDQHFLEKYWNFLNNGLTESQIQRLNYANPKNIDDLRGIGAILKNLETIELFQEFIIIPKTQIFFYNEDNPFFELEPEVYKHSRNHINFPNIGSIEAIESTIGLQQLMRLSSIKYCQENNSDCYRNI